MQACEANRENVVKFLLEHGPIPDTEDIYGHKPRDVAQVLGHDHLVHLIDNHAGKVNGAVVPLEYLK